MFPMEYITANGVGLPSINSINLSKEILNVKYQDRSVDVTIPKKAAKRYKESNGNT